MARVVRTFDPAGEMRGTIRETEMNRRVKLFSAIMLGVCAGVFIYIDVLPKLSPGSTFPDKGQSAPSKGKGSELPSDSEYVISPDDFSNDIVSKSAPELKNFDALLAAYDASMEQSLSQTSEAEPTEVSVA